MKVRYEGKVREVDEVIGPDELGNYFVRFTGGPNLQLYPEEFEVFMETVTVRGLTEAQMFILEDGILRYESAPEVELGKTFIRGSMDDIGEIAWWADDLSPEDTGVGYIEGSGLVDVSPEMEQFGMAQKWRSIYSLQAKLWKALGEREKANRARWKARDAKRGRV